MKIFSLSNYAKPRAWAELSDSEKFYVAQTLGGSRGYNRVLEFMDSLEPVTEADKMKANLDFVRARFEEFEQDIKEILG